MSARTWSAVSSSRTGAPGIAIRTTETSDWPAGPTVSQRKSPSSGRVASEVTSQPSCGSTTRTRRSPSTRRSWAGGALPTSPSPSWGTSAGSPSAARPARHLGRPDGDPRPAGDGRRDRRPGARRSWRRASPARSSSPPRTARRPTRSSGPRRRVHRGARAAPYGIDAGFRDPSGQQLPAHPGPARARLILFAFASRPVMIGTALDRGARGSVASAVIPTSRRRAVPHADDDRGLLRPVGQVALASEVPEPRPDGRPRRARRSPTAPTPSAPRRPSRRTPRRTPSRSTPTARASTAGGRRRATGRPSRAEARPSRRARRRAARRPTCLEEGQGRGRELAARPSAQRAQGRLDPDQLVEHGVGGLLITSLASTRSSSSRNCVYERDVHGLDHRPHPQRGRRRA